MDFGNQEYKIQIISMEDTFIRDLPSKMSKRDVIRPVQNFVEAISKSTLKDSLEEISRSD